MQSANRSCFCRSAAEQAAQVVIAYEPIWAIGTGKSSTSQDANEVIAYIRTLVKDLYDETVADAVRIQYGGSVKPENVTEYMDKATSTAHLSAVPALQPASFISLVEGAK